MPIYHIQHPSGLGTLVFREASPTTIGLVSWGWALVSALQFCFPDVLASVELKSTLLTSCNGLLLVSNFFFSTVVNFPRANLLSSMLSKQNPQSSLAMMFWIIRSFIFFWFQTVKIPGFFTKQTQGEREAVIPWPSLLPFFFPSYAPEL